MQLSATVENKIQVSEMIDAKRKKAPLEGIRVLAISQFGAGPFATLNPVSYTHLTLPTILLV